MNQCCENKMKYFREGWPLDKLFSHFIYEMEIPVVARIRVTYCPFCNTVHNVRLEKDTNDIPQSFYD